MMICVCVQPVYVTPVYFAPVWVTLMWFVTNEYFSVIGMVMMQNRQFFTISTERMFFLFSNYICIILLAVDN